MQHLKPPNHQKIQQYYTQVKPLLAQMADLVLLYRHPVFEMGKDGWGVSGMRLSHHVWMNVEMEIVFDELAATVVAIRESYFGEGSE